MADLATSFVNSVFVFLTIQCLREEKKQAFLQKTHLSSFLSCHYL